MSVLVMGMLDDIRFGLRRASNAQAMAQAQWYALGAESLAMAQIDRLSTRAGAQAGLAGLEQRPLVFPIEHGMIRARLSDATACRSEEHTSELQSLMRNTYAGFCLQKKKKQHNQ